jgi:hypothetical protein
MINYTIENKMDVYPHINVSKNSQNGFLRSILIHHKMKKILNKWKLAHPLSGISELVEIYRIEQACNGETLENISVLKYDV